MIARDVRSCIHFNENWNEDTDFEWSEQTFVCNMVAAQGPKIVSNGTIYVLSGVNVILQ